MALDTRCKLRAAARAKALRQSSAATFNEVLVDAPREQADAKAKQEADAAAAKQATEARASVEAKAVVETKAKEAAAKQQAEAAAAKKAAEERAAAEAKAKQAAGAAAAKQATEAHSAAEAKAAAETKAEEAAAKQQAEGAATKKAAEERAAAESRTVAKTGAIAAPAALPAPEPGSAASRAEQNRAAASRLVGKTRTDADTSNSGVGLELPSIGAPPLPTLPPFSLSLPRIDLTGPASAVSVAGATISAAVTSVLEPLSATYMAAAAATQSALPPWLLRVAEDAASGGPRAPLALAFLLLSPLAVAVALRSFLVGGYAGDVTPAAAEQRLLSDDATLMVDVRSDDARAEQGIPALRKSARTKVVALPLELPLPTSTRGLVRDSRTLSMDRAVTLVRAVAPPRAAVILLDGGDGGAIALARAVTRAGGGISALTIKGGYPAWAAADGLRVRTDKSDYSSSALLGAAEEAAEEAAETLSTAKQTLADPLKAAGVASAAFAAVAVAVNWEYVLQVSGVLGVLWSLARSQGVSKRSLEVAEKTVRGL